MSTLGGRPFKPAFGGKTIVPGCSDKTPRSMADQQGSSPVKLTTASRASAALEQYWQQQQQQQQGATTSSHSPGRTQQQQGKHNPLPGGERELAHKTRDACWRDSVHLAHKDYAPDCPTTPKDIEEKEKGRTRGIPGYTGCQPPPGASKPPALPSPVEASRWTAINAFDERRPRIKGIPGYTGHQPHSSSGGSAAAPGSLQGSAAAATAPKQQQHQQQRQSTTAAAAAAADAYPTAYVSSTGSRISSPPLYFCDGVQVPATQVPVPHTAPHSAATAGPAAAAPPCCGSSCAAAAAAMASCALHSSAGGFGSSADSSGRTGSSGGGGWGAGAQAAEVMVVSGLATADDADVRWTAAAPGMPSAPGAPGAATAAGSPQVSSVGNTGAGPAWPGSSSGGGVGRPAVGPWRTTYSSTFVQQEAYDRLMQQFRDAAKQQQRSK